MPLAKPSNSESAESKTYAFTSFTPSSRHCRTQSQQLPVLACFAPGGSIEHDKPKVGDTVPHVNWPVEECLQFHGN